MAQLKKLTFEELKVVQLGKESSKTHPHPRLTIEECSSPEEKVDICINICKERRAIKMTWKKGKKQTTKKGNDIPVVVVPSSYQPPSIGY
ncbi:hypothetical protein Tco_0488198 [Tanacetum coccineum]